MEFAQRTSGLIVPKWLEKAVVNTNPILRGCEPYGFSKGPYETDDAFLQRWLWACAPFSGDIFGEPVFVSTPFGIERDFTREWEYALA